MGWNRLHVVFIRVILFLQRILQTEREREVRHFNHVTQMYKVQNNVPLVPHHVHPAEPSAHWETTSPRVHTQPSHTPHRAVSQHTDNTRTPHITVSHQAELSHTPQNCLTTKTPHITVSHPTELSHTPKGATANLYLGVFLCFLPYVLGNQLMPSVCY